MPRYQQVFQFVGVGLPFIGLPLAIWLLWGHGVSAADLAIMASLPARPQRPAFPPMN